VPDYYDIILSHYKTLTGKIQVKWFFIINLIACFRADFFDVRCDEHYQFPVFVAVLHVPEKIFNIWYAAQHRQALLIELPYLADQACQNHGVALSDPDSGGKLTQVDDRI
jgi:hypothetical protein